MHALPFAVSLVIAAALAPALLGMLSDGGWRRANFRGRELPFPFGVLIPAAAMIALVPLTLVQRLGDGGVLHPELAPIALYALGVVALGLVDDLLGPLPRDADPPRGWRGHALALLGGRLTTGALKASGSAGLALFAAAALQRGNGRWLLAAAVLVLATNAFNLLDLRPGRSWKALLLLGAGLLAGSRSLRPLWALGLFAGPALLAGMYDLRERAMLGDTGASLLGALAGLWLVLTLSGTGQLVALVLLLALTLYGELRSLSGLIERTPLLRGIDSLGRAA
jgi:UDP-N-acetylmuramyl pentapeptide phosphotransferase/UDP-N-acetylglucosamine-1-phosphate transferase